MPQAPSGFSEGGDAARAFEVLIIDDDAIDVMIIKRALAKSEFPISLQIADHGEDALRLLRREGPFVDARQPQLILLDLNLPTMDGLRFLEQFRSDSTLDQVPVVVITASEDPVALKQAYTAGANSVVTKITSRDGMENLLTSIADYWFKTSSVFYLDL
ncbi:MAG: response regulator [Methyloligellaceae bacterium]